MDSNSEMTSQDVGLVNEHSAACVMCRRMFEPDNDDLETITVCGDCKFLLLEDVGAAEHNSLRRRRRGRRIRYSSSESIENIFSQQISYLFNLVRHNHSTVSGNENQSIDGDSSARILPNTSSRTTPTGSSRWRRVLSDSESEGFSNLESPYHGESDAISYSTYGGDSDVSVDGNSVLDMEVLNLNQHDEDSNIDSDTDIDPMNAALDQWNSDEEEEESEWEEADIEDYTVESTDTGPPLLPLSSPHERHRLFDSPESEGLIRWRIRHGRRIISEELEFPQYVGNSGDYLDSRGFEELLEHLADADSSRRGAPPTSISFMKSLPCVIIGEEHENHDDLTCAVCKDVLSVGTEVNKLPCLHLYHPCCIVPWLRTRNSCPLCRFELPTDDRDYEEGKRSSNIRLRVREINQQYQNEESFLDGAEGNEVARGGIMEEVRVIDGSNSGREGSRRGWFLFAAAAPIVSIVGIVLVLWLGNSQGRGRTQNHDIRGRGLVSMPDRNQRADRTRSWWSLF